MPVSIIQEIRKPLLEAFRDEMPHSYVMGELLNMITSYIGEDPNEMSSGDKNILRENIKKARDDLKRNGLISSPSKNTYMITNLGLEVLDDDPESIDDDYLARLKNKGTSEALAITEPDEIFAEPESEPEIQTETEILEDPEGDLDLTEPEEIVEDLPEMNQDVEEVEVDSESEPEPEIESESESDEASLLENFGDDDIAEFAAEPDPEEPDDEPEPEIEPEPEEPESESESEPESESETDFVITNSNRTHSNEHKHEQDSAESSVKSLESVLEKFNEELAAEVLKKTAAIPSDKFEMLVIDLLSKMGYRAFQNARYTTEVSGDDCIHGVILENEPGLSPIYIQARKLAPGKTIGKTEIQNFVKALADKGGKGLFATTASFSAQALNYARAEKIMLIDGSRLANLMITNNFCVSIEKVFEIKSIDTESFGEYEKQ